MVARIEAMAVTRLVMATVADCGNAAQGAAYVTVHCSVLTPAFRPVTRVVGDAALANCPAPLTTLQAPVAPAGSADALSVALAPLTVCAGPALGAKALARVSVSSAEVDGGVHPTPLMVQVKT